MSQILEKVKREKRHVWQLGIVLSIKMKYTLKIIEDNWKKMSCLMKVSESSAIHISNGGSYKRM